MSCRRNRGITLCRAEAVTEKKQYKRNINGNGTEIKLEGKYKMKKLLITLLLAAGLLTACTTATHTAKKRENTGKAILGISPGKKEITVTAVTADGSPVQVEGCTVTELPSDEETILTATGTKVVLKGDITELDCSSNELTALDVRGLTALQTLYCDNNRLSSLDVRHLTALQWLDCHFNKLTSLDVQGLPALQVLECSDNQLTLLDAQGLPALQKLYCQDNKITSLDVRGLTSLQVLMCYDNRLTALNVRRLTALQELDCSSNAIASIDVRGLTGLHTLYCDNNRLTSLDVQGLTALQELACSDNQLTALNVQDLPALQALSFQHNRLEEDAIIRILNSLPDRKTDEEGLAVLYSEGEKLPKESGSAVPASAEFRAAFKAAKQKNWKLYMQTEDENGTEIRLQEE